MQVQAEEEDKEDEDPPPLKSCPSLSRLSSEQREQRLTPEL
jgi:hypothetical protein